MNKFKITYPILLFAFFLGLTNISCDKATPTTTEPRNYFEGVMDGRAFINTTLNVYKDGDDFLTLTGNAGNGISMIAFVNGKETQDYPATQGTLLEVSELLDQTVTLDSLLIDSIQTTLNTGNSLPVGECYAILISENNFYYSNRGTITLTSFDGSINRVYGEIDLELKNIPNGTRYIQAFFEDVYYTDCPEIGICIL